MKALSTNLFYCPAAPVDMASHQRGYSHWSLWFSTYDYKNDEYDDTVEHVLYVKPTKKQIRKLRKQSKRIV